MSLILPNTDGDQARHGKKTRIVIAEVGADLPPIPFVPRPITILLESGIQMGYIHEYVRLRDILKSSHVRKRGTYLPRRRQGIGNKVQNDYPGFVSHGCRSRLEDFQRGIQLAQILLKNIVPPILTSYKGIICLAAPVQHVCDM